MAQSTSKSKKTQGIILIVIVLAMAATGFFMSQKGKAELKKYGHKCKGTVVEIYEKRSRGRHMHYEFTIEGKTYKGSETIGNKPFKVGDKITVLYSTKNPRFNKMLIEKQAPN